MTLGMRRLSSRTFLTLFCLASPALAGVDLPLVEAVKQADSQTVQSLLDQDTDVNARQADGSTALHWAVHKSDEKIVALLLEAGADPNVHNDYGVFPLTVACTNGSAPLVERLLQAGADADATISNGESVIMTCARTGNERAVHSLLERGADANARETEREQTALMWAVSQKHAGVAQLLIDHQADVSARSKNGFTPLMFAARVGHVESAKVLIDAGADVNEALPVAETYNPPAPFDIPPGDTFDPAAGSTETESGTMTPLLMASASGHQEVAVYLLTRGADPNARDAQGATALHYAMLKGIASISGVSLANYVSHLFRPNMPELVNALLAKGADPNVRIAGAVPMAGRGAKGAIGATPLLLAAAATDPSIIRALVEKGADPLVATEKAITPLMAAAGVGRLQDFTESEEMKALDAIKLMVALGADINAVNQNNLTALHGAANLGANSIIQFLGEKGANLEVRDVYQQTPLSIASGVHLPWTPKGEELGEVVRQETADLLLRLGATPLDTPGYFTPVEEDSDVYRLNPRRAVSGVSIPE